MQLFNSQWNGPSKTLETLRKKWCEVPGPAQVMERKNTEEILKFSDSELKTFWETCHREASQGPGFQSRGWYFELYRDFFKGKHILDFGSGFGHDGIYFSLQGAQVTFADIIPSNLEVIQRLAKIYALPAARFHFIDSVDSLKNLPGPFDVVFANGSLHHAPASFVRQEVQALLSHLKVGGRWIQLAYPKSRWLAEGSLAFEKWGKKTDGENTPWAEWYDLEKLLQLLAPAQFQTVLNFEWGKGQFNWFDLQMVKL